MEVSLVETWKKMIELQKTGKVKTIGVSNFTIEYIKAITKATGVKPVVNQVEAHPLLPQDDLVAFCKEEGIHLTAYSPLGNNCASLSLLVYNDGDRVSNLTSFLVAGRTKLVEYPAVQEVADKIGATTAQVLVAWGAYRGYSVIPKSVKEGMCISVSILFLLARPFALYYLILTV